MLREGLVNHGRGSTQGVGGVVVGMTYKLIMNGRLRAVRLRLSADLLQASRPCDLLTRFHRSCGVQPRSRAICA
jgi:hypothetical protein